LPHDYGTKAETSAVPPKLAKPSHTCTIIHITDNGGFRQHLLISTEMFRLPSQVHLK